MRKFFPPDGLIVVAALVYGTLFFLSCRHPANSLKSDSTGYLALAQNMRRDHVFSESPGIPKTPELFRLPGYPLFLAVTGAQPFSFGLTIGLQCLMGFGLVFLVWPWLYRLGGLTGATLGSVFLCLDPVSVLHQNLLLTEPLMSFVLAGALCVGLDYFENPNKANAWRCGLLFGAATLIKPIALFPAAALVLCALPNRRSVFLLALFTFAFPLMWVARNFYQTGRPVYTVQGGYALFLYPAANALAMDAGCTRMEAVERMETSLRAEGFDPEKNSSTESVVYQKKAIQIMKEHPLATLEVHLRGAAAILGGTGLVMILDLLDLAPPSVEGASGIGSGTLTILKNYPLLIGVQIAYLLFLLGGYFLFLRGQWALLQRGRWPFAAFLLLSVLLILAASAHQGYYRFRLPLVPFLSFGIAAAFLP